MKSLIVLSLVLGFTLSTLSFAAQNNRCEPVATGFSERTVAANAQEEQKGRDAKSKASKALGEQKLDPNKHE